MKKTVITQVIIFLLVGLKCANAQTTTIEVEFVKDGKMIAVNDNSFLQVIMPKDTLFFGIKNSRFTLPDSLRKNGQRYTLNINRYKLDYGGVALIWNVLKPKWIITIDTHPFAEEHLYILKDEKKGVKWISILNNGTGSNYIGTEHSKLKRSK